MPPIPLLRPKEVTYAFEKLGWEVVRQKGSHIIMTKTGQIATLSIPKHDLVARGTLRDLIKRSGESLDEFLNHV
jgi:predicted RNA binding protein YcfA (HicA-like mRNA interferase family)